jgi:hypothetical protein
MTVSVEAELLLKNFPIVCVGGSAGGLDAVGTEASPRRHELFTPSMRYTHLD